MKYRCILLCTGLLLVSLTPLHAKTIDTCFSPYGQCDKVLISWIDVSLFTLDAAIYGLTDESIAQALIRAHHRGVKVRVVQDKVQSAGKHNVSDQLIAAGIPVHIQRGSQGGILHHKFLILDSQFVITGSFNWTTGASKRNDENFVVIDDRTPRFQKEFDRLWALRKSTTTHANPPN